MPPKSTPASNKKSTKSPNVNKKRVASKTSAGESQVATKRPVQGATKKPKASSANEPKKRRNKPGTVAVREIKRYQKSTDLLLAKAPFARLVREIIDEEIEKKGEYRLQKTALLDLQEIVEVELVKLMENAKLSASHAKRVTVMAKDLELAKRVTAYKFD